MSQDQQLTRDEGFAHDEERFFNEPEASNVQPTEQESEHPSLNSLAPAVLDANEAVFLLTEPKQTADTQEPAFQLRRKRLRQGVLLTLGASVALLLLGVARLPRREQRVDSASMPAHAARLAIAPANPTSTLVTSQPVSPVASESSTPPTPITQLDDHVARESAHALLVSARSLLQAGRIRAGVDVARQALAANGNDAEPYILLAAGLQDLGDWPGAQRVFAACKSRAHTGSQAECSYFSSQKR